MAMKWMKTRGALWTGLAVAALFLAFACSSDSPSEPQRDPAPPPGSGGGGDFNVVVTVEPGTLVIGTGDQAEVRIRVTNRNTGAAPPNGATAVVSTNLGSFDPNDPSVTSGTITLVNGQALLQFFPGVNAGTAVIQVEFQGSIGTDRVALVEPDTFFLSFVDPDQGQAGDSVTIHGAGFVRPLRVVFGGVSARVLGSAPNRIQVEVPPPGQDIPRDSTTTVPVSVTIRVNQEGQAQESLASAFTYRPGGDALPTPVIFSVDPPGGSNEGGTQVTIVGDNFEPPVQVFFGDLEGTVVSATETRIVAITPPAVGNGIDNRNKIVDVKVVNINSGFEGTLSPGFGYGGPPLFIDRVSPRRVEQRGGELVSIFGSGFVSPLRVTLTSTAGGGSVVATVQSVDPDTIVIIAPEITDELLNTEACDDNNDGQEGERFVETAFDVTVSLEGAADDEDTLLGALIYEPGDLRCRNDVAPVDPPEPPEASFTFTANNLDVIFENTTSGDFNSSTWTFGDGSPPSNETNPIHTYAVAGTYLVTLTVSNSVGDTDETSQFVTVPPP